MGIGLRVLDMDRLFDELNIEPTIINDYNISDPDDEQALRDQLMTYYDGDSIDEGASCYCRHVVGNYNKDVVCPKCGTRVQSTTDRPIQSNLWFRPPPEVKALIHPEAWVQLSKALSTVNGPNMLQWLVSTDYTIDPEQKMGKDVEARFTKLRASGIPRGLNNFIDNFDSIVDYLFKERIFSLGSSGKVKALRELRAFIDQNKHLFFPKHIPIPSRLCFVVENTASMTYVDKVIANAIDAVWTIASINATRTPMHPNRVQNRVVRATMELASFYDMYTKERLSTKPGLIRKHVLGGRLHLTGRAVITSISDPHDRNSLHIPWGMATQILKYHIINKLLKRRYTPNQALEFVYSNVLRYNAELDRIFQELIEESPNGRGIPAMFQRNPTLQRGSTQKFFIDKVEKDPRKNVVSMSALVLRAPNADFDGDQLNIIIIPDNYLSHATDRLAPDRWALSTDQARTLSSHLELQGPIVDTACNYLYAEYINY